jgi:hypothetical protein
MCLVASALLAGSMVRRLLTLDGLGLPVPVADTAGAIAWLAILSNARAYTVLVEALARTKT